MDESDALDQIIEAEHFEAKNISDVPFSDSPHKKHSEKRCCCGGHSMNDGDKQYKGRQFDKHREGYYQSSVKR